MAQDATGTPTPKGIPKYNPDVDAPSGLGFNAAMDAIDGLLTFLKIRKNSTGSDFERQRLNLIEGAGIQLTVADDAANNEVDVTIAAATPAPQTYTPTWQGTGSNPAIGNGTIVGSYIQIGKMVSARVRIIMGSTTTYGSGTWSVGLPVAAASGDPTLGHGFYADASAGLNYLGTWQSFLYHAASPLAGVTPTSPFTWAVGDVLDLSIVYEAA